MRRPLLPLVLLLLSCTASVPRAEHERQDVPDGAAAYYAAKRAGTDDVNRSYDVARDAMRRMPRYATNGDTFIQPLRPSADAASAETRPFRKWQYLGPGNIGGRTRALVIDPVEPHVMFAGGVSGGVWKTTSGGAKWRPVGDAMANIAVNSLAMHPRDRNVLYAGTGEGYFREEVRGTALPLRGNGIFVSRDAGETWTQLASTANENFHYVNDLVISTHDPSRVYAATRTGVWLSADAGASWTRSLATSVKGGCLDLAWRGGTSDDYLFVSCGTFERASVYRNAHAQLSSSGWQSVLSDELMGRTTLAVAPSNPSIVYALSATNEPGAKYQGLHAVWRSSQNGDAGSWTATVTGKSADVVGANMLTNVITVDNASCGGPAEEPFTMGWYCNTIAVDPADPERVWVGGVDLFRSDDGGATWGFASYWWSTRETYPYVHADQHAIVFHPNYNGTSNRTAFFANDGGIARTHDARAEVARGRAGMCLETVSKLTFEDLNNDYGVTQFYHGAVFPDGRQFIAGAQDNGTLIGNSDDPGRWKFVSGGDGGYVAVNQRIPSVVYAQAQFGAFRRSNNGGESFYRFPIGAMQDRFLFIAPFVLDPNEEDTVWYGGTRLWRNRMLSPLARMSAPVPDDALISAIAVAPGMSNRVVAGTNQGHIVYTDAADSSTPTTVWPHTKPRDGFVSSLAFDPVDPNVVYATYAGFGGVHVWRSTDGGATWAPRDGSGAGTLPDIPAHSLAVDPTRRERLYLGTDLGVFVSLDGGGTWAVENTGYPAVVTEAVVIGQGAGGKAVYAFTHGRGAWRAELTVPSVPKRRAVRP